MVNNPIPTIKKDKIVKTKLLLIPPSHIVNRKIIKSWKVVYAKLNSKNPSEERISNLLKIRKTIKFKIAINPHKNKTKIILLVNNLFLVTPLDNINLSKLALSSIDKLVKTKPWVIDSEKKKIKNVKIKGSFSSLSIPKLIRIKSKETTKYTTR